MPIIIEVGPCWHIIIQICQHNNCAVSILCNHMYIYFQGDGEQIKCSGRTPTGVCQIYNRADCVSLVWHILCKPETDVTF